MGVDVFFAISGFVVTLSLLRRSKKNKDVKMSAYLLQFYQRRLVRLAPSLMLCLVPTVILLTFLVPSWWPNKNDWYDTGAYSVFGMSNLYLAFQESEGYFDTEGGSQMNPFLHTWSLGVEEQFYLIYPVVMYLGTSSTSTSSFCRVSTWVVAFALVSLVISVVLTFTASEKIGFYFSPARFWEMAAGGCSMLLAQHYDDALQRMGGTCSLVVDFFVIGVLAVSFAFGHDIWPYSSFPFPLAFLPVAATCVFMALGSSKRNLINLLLSKKPAVYVGKLSYGLYLVHWPIFVLIRFNVGLKDSWVLLALVLSFAFAILMHHGVENKIHRSGISPKYLFGMLVLYKFLWRCLLAKCCGLHLTTFNQAAAAVESSVRPWI